MLQSKVGFFFLALLLCASFADCSPMIKKILGLESLSTKDKKGSTSHHQHTDASSSPHQKAAGATLYYTASPRLSSASQASELQDYDDYYSGAEVSHHTTTIASETLYHQHNGWSQSHHASKWRHTTMEKLVEAREAIRLHHLRQHTPAEVAQQADILDLINAAQQSQRRGRFFF
jgi:hypothetical protein